MNIKSIYFLLLLCIACVACDDYDTVQVQFPSDFGGVPGGTPTGSVNLPSGDFSSFDISINDLDSFVDGEDIVIKDESDDHYEDYLENSSFSHVVDIVFDGDKATFSEIDGVSITADGAYVTVNSTVSKVRYSVSGTTSDGGLKIYSEKKFALSLNGVSILSSKGAAINIQSSKRAFIVLADGTENNLEDASKYTNTPDGEDQKSALFSEGKLLFSGSGSLVVKGNYKHAVCSDDYVFVRPGVQLSVPYSASDAIHTNDGIYIYGGRLELSPSGDGMDTDGVIDIAAGLVKVQVSAEGKKAIKAAGNISVTGGNIVTVNSGDAVYEEADSDITSCSCLKSDSHISISGGKVCLKATGKAGKGLSCDSTFCLSGGELKVITTGAQFVYGSLDSSPKGVKAEGNVVIDGGLLWAKTTGGEGAEALESKSDLVVNGGEIVLFGYDDCINASKSITFNGGKVYCISTGNDGIDSNGTLTVNGGLVVSFGSTQPEEGFDCDQNTFKITGGTILGIGGATSSPTSSVCSQNSVVFGGSGSQGDVLTICDASNNLLMSCTLPRSYNQMTLLYSSPDLKNGTYSIYSGGSVSNVSSSFYDFVLNGTISGGSSLTSFTVSSLLTKVGNTSQGGPGGGGPRW